MKNGYNSRTKQDGQLLQVRNELTSATKLVGRVVPNAPQATMSQTTGNGGVRTRLPNSRIDENHLCPMA